MAKLYFRYGAMNSGKSTALLQVAFNYEERGQRVLLAKPAIDTKADSKIQSRIGVSRPVDIIFDLHDDPYDLVMAHQRSAAQTGQEKVSCVLVDESQFLNSTQIDGLFRLAVLSEIPVLCYGIRTDFRTHAFPGSRRLLEIAHSLEELKTICRCGRKAIFNARSIAGRIVFDGDQVAIDGDNVEYESLCGNCYLAESDGYLGVGF